MNRRKINNISLKVLNLKDKLGIVEKDIKKLKPIVDSVCAKNMILSLIEDMNSGIDTIVDMLGEIDEEKPKKKRKV